MVFDKIEEYFHMLADTRQLKPGDRLPGYKELARQFDTTYLTVQRSIKKLEQQGLVRVERGVGSFLNGGDELKMDLYLTPSTYDFEELQPILDEISRANDLHLKITLKDRYSADFQQDVGDHRVVLAEFDPWSGLSGNSLDFSAFPDYLDFMKQFSSFIPKCGNSQIPFCLFTYQGAVNPEILRDIGFDRELKEFRDFDFWEELAEKCRKNAVIPAMKFLAERYFWCFPAFALSTILMMRERKSVETLFNPPYFDTENGHRIFDILENFETVGFHRRQNRCFLDGDVAVDFFLGSWAAVQYKRKYGLRDSQLRIVPIRCGKQKIVHYLVTRLECFVKYSITQSEKDRVWIFVKELLSKKVQKKLVALNGALSPRSDMKPSDYSWADREDFRNFFPEKGDYLLNQENFPREKYAALSALYEFYETYKKEVSRDSILQFMDRKLAAR